MARFPRVHFPGAVYHVMARGVDRRNIYSSENDRMMFLATLENARKQAGAQLFAYCLMGNHFHLVLKVAQVPLSSIMQRLLTSYAADFNRQNDREGHLFQARFTAILCMDDRYLTSLVRYIHLNPVRAKLVENPRDWSWSSYRAYLETGKDPLVTLASDLPELEGEIEKDFDPWPRQKPDSPQPRLLRSATAAPVSLERLAERIARESSISSEALFSISRRPAVAAARRRFIRRAVLEGFTSSVIASILRVSLPTISRALASVVKIERTDTNIG